MSTLVESLFPERFETPSEHPRKTIREGIHNRLSSPVNPDHDEADWKYWTPAGPNVFERKENEIRLDDLPMVYIRYGDEEVTGRSPTGFDGYDKRALELFMEVYVSVEPGSSAEDRLDEFAFFIEACMNGYQAPHYNSEILLLKTEYDTDYDAATPIAVGRLTFEVQYLCPKLFVDFGLWDRDGACIVNNGPNPPIQTLIIDSNFGTETIQVDP